MKLFRQIVGGILLGLAIAFLLRIPKHLGSSDPKANSKIVTDIVFAVVVGAGGILVIRDSSKPPGDDR